MKKWLGLLCCLPMGLLQAALEFDEKVKELNAKPDEKVLTIDFPFRNGGDEVVKIQKYEATCSCMSLKVKDGKLVYPPGETGMIRAVFDMGNFSGDTAKILQLWVDDDPKDKPSILLTVNVHIPIIVQLEPKTLRWEVGEEAKPKTISIKMNYEEPIKVLDVQCASPNFTTETKTVEEGKCYDLVITPKTTESPALAVIAITTDCPIQRHASQRGFAMVRQPIKKLPKSK